LRAGKDGFTPSSKEEKEGMSTLIVPKNEGYLPDRSSTSCLLSRSQSKRWQSFK
jgi:hypothetical protein